MNRKKTYDWLRANLGPRCLAPLTSTDADALCAAIAILELYTHDHDSNVLDAFQVVVAKMQTHCYHLAFHAIAMVMEWEDREKVWGLAGLPAPLQISKCKFEPGGPGREALKVETKTAAEMLEGAR